MTTFSDLGLAAPLLKALDAEGYKTPTPIQSQAIPHVMAGRDLMGLAQTGTGKTAAFALPILHRLAADPKPRRGRHCRVLVLSPTRELASQIAESFRTYGRQLKLSVAVVYGGVSAVPQKKALNEGPDILVATPGRLLDHMGMGNLRLDGTEVLVLDEADQMLDLGFLPAIRRVVRALPKQRQNLFFSATMPAAISGLAGELLNDPATVSVVPQATTVERVDQRVILLPNDAKRQVLANLFADPAFSRVLVFTRTKRGADKVAHYLEESGVGAEAIHGNKSQSQRERALAAFKAGRSRALVATDIAARGIDVDAVSHVVNFELPNVPESYVHRIGRTARAGAEGTAISLCCGEERGYLRDIEKLIRLRIPSETMDGAEAEAATSPSAPKQGRNGPRRDGRPQGQQRKAGPRQEQSRAKQPRHKGRGGDRPQRGEGPRPSGKPGDSGVAHLGFMQPR